MKVNYNLFIRNKSNEQQIRTRTTKKNYGWPNDERTRNEGSTRYDGRRIKRYVIRHDWQINERPRFKRYWQASRSMISFALLFEIFFILFKSSNYSLKFQFIWLIEHNKWAHDCFEKLPNYKEVETWRYHINKCIIKPKV